MKIADYGKAITSYIQSPTKSQKTKTKLLAEAEDRTFLADGTIPQEKPFTLERFKDKANIYMAAYQNNALPVDDIRLKLDEFTRKGIEDGTFTADEAIKVVKDLRSYYRDLAQKQRLRGVVEGIGTVEREDFSKGSPFAVGEIRKAALANLDKILEDYYSGMGTRALTKKYFPNSADAKKGTSSSVLENVIKENADAKKVAKRPSPIGTTAKGVSPAKVILNNPKAKAEFIKFANAKGNTILMSMEEAGKIAKKYLPEGTKVSGYSSRTGFMDSGLRELITKKVQLGSNPEGEVNTAESAKKAKKKRDTRIKTTAPFKASGTPNFAFHHIMPIGGEVALTTNDIAIINQRMNSVLGNYNKQLNSIADGITNAYNKQPPDLKRIDQLNKAGESIVKKAVKELPKEYRNLIGFNKLQPVFDEYGTVINLNPERVGGVNQKKPGIKLEELSKEQATALRKQIKTDALKFEKAGLKDKILSGTGKVLKGVGKVIKPIGYAVGTKALFDAQALAKEQGIELSNVDKLLAVDSGDPNVAINNYMRRNDPEFAAAERAKDLAKMTDDFEEVGQTTFGKYNDQIKNIKLP